MSEYVNVEIQRLPQSPTLKFNIDRLKAFYSWDRIIAGIWRCFVFFRGSRETRQPHYKNNKNNTKLIVN